MAMSFPRGALTVSATVLAFAAVSAAPRAAAAATPAPELMGRLAAYASHYEAMRYRASYVLEGRLERVDGDGNADNVKEMNARIVADGKDAHLSVLRYVEDGEDKTDEARTKAQKRESEPKEERAKNEIKMPFEASQQSRYTFDQVKVDAKDSSRVLVSFVPKQREENMIEGTAWVDTREGTLISAGFKVTKTSFFVDYVNITVEFGATTTLGPAISKVTMEGKGGLFFLKKRFRANATMSSYSVCP